MANNARLEETMAHIEAHPEGHDQATWGRRTLCGTKMCFAGTAAVLAGGTLIWIRRATWEHGAFEVLVDGKERVISHFAQEVLGLTADQKYYLFFVVDSVEDLRAAVDAIKADPAWDPYENVDY